MKQIFEHYEKWEDYQNGMYDTSQRPNEPELINLSISLLSNQTLFFETCLNVINNWPVASGVNLTNQSINRHAWLGQASCSFLYGVPEILTRKAWVEMEEINRIKANKTADKAIYYYEREASRLHQDMAKQMLLEWTA